MFIPVCSAKRGRGRMFRAREKIRLLSVSIAALLCSAVVTPQDLSASKPLLKTRVDPKEFGIQDDTVTVISGTAFKGNRTGYGVGSGLALYAPLNTDSHFNAALNLPAGAVIDFIGLNSATDTDAI